MMPEIATFSSNITNICQLLLQQRNINWAQIITFITNINNLGEKKSYSKRQNNANENAFYSIQKL